jgi:hypothetical protein
MTGKQQNEQQEELRDLDVLDAQAERIVGGVKLENILMTGYAVKPPPGKGGGTAGAGWDIRAPKA